MEQGDATTKRRLKAFAEKEWSPYFYTDGDWFSWSFDLNEDQPRGQLNSLLILSEIGNAEGRFKVNGALILETQN